MHGVKRCVDEQGKPEPREGKSKCKRDGKKLKGRGEKDVKKMQIQLTEPVRDIRKSHYAVHPHTLPWANSVTVQPCAAPAA